MHYLEDANNQSERMWKLVLKYVFSFFAVVVIVTCVVSGLLCLWIHGNFDVEYMYHPGKVRLVIVYC